MALDSYKGKSIDVGRNFEGTREGPFFEQNVSRSNSGLIQSAVNNLVEAWKKVELAEPSEKEVNEAMFNGLLDSAARRLNSNGVVISKSELMQKVKVGYLNMNFDFEMEDLNAMGGR